MKVGKRQHYAAAAMLFLSMKDQSRLYSVKEIARQVGITEKNMEAVFALLKARGLVRSLKGKNGGYQLSREPEKLSLYDVVKAVEGDPEEDPTGYDFIWADYIEVCEKFLKEKTFDLIQQEYLQKGKLNYYVI